MTVPGTAIVDVPGAVEAALRLRREQGIAPHEPLPCVMSLAEDHLGLDVVVARLPTGCSGFYLPRARRGLVAANGTHAVVRQRFTVAHEAGHHVLGHGAAPRIVPLAETPSAVEAPAGPAVGEGAATTGGVDATTGSPPPDATASAPLPARPRRSTDPREKAANAFAAELLCPAVAARTFVDRYAPTDATGAPVVDFDLVVRFSCAFGISAAAVLTRLETSGVLTDPARRAALQLRVDAGEHVPRYGQLGLSSLRDELQAIADVDTLPRLPEGVNAEVLLAVTGSAPSAGPMPAPIRALRALLGLEVPAVAG